MYNSYTTSMTDILILTPVEVEYDTLRSMLDNLKPVSRNIFTDFYERSTFKGKYQLFNIVIKRIGKTNGTAKFVTKNAIKIFNPRVVFLAGIAGGFKDVRIKDILVCTKAYSYENGKETDEGFKSRPESQSFDNELIKLAERISYSNAWRQRSPYAEGVEVKFGPIASGSKVIATEKTEIFKRIKRFYNDTLAVDMEAMGFAEAVRKHKNIDALIVRGISDMLAGKSETDKMGYQKQAAHNVMAFVLELIYQLKIEDTITMTTKELTQFIYQEIEPVIFNLAGQKTTGLTKKRQDVFAKIKPFVENQEAYTDWKEEPEDTDSQGAFRKCLLKILDSHAELKRELVELIKKQEKSSNKNTIEVKDSKNVIASIGDISIRGGLTMGDKQN